MKNYNRAFAALALSGATALLGGCGVFTNASGERIGTVNQLSKQGFAVGLCPTDEGELALANIKGAKSGGGSSSTFDFHVADPKILAQLQKAYDDNKVVKVEWIEKVAPWVCTQKNEHVITEVTEVDERLISPLTGGLRAQLDDGAISETEFPSGQGARERVLICREAAAPKLTPVGGK